MSFEEKLIALLNSANLSANKDTFANNDDDNDSGDVCPAKEN